MNQKERHAVHRIVVSVFAGREAARLTNDDLKVSGSYGAHKTLAHTVVELDDRGRAHFHWDDGTQGLRIGFVAGSLLGLLGGPDGLLALAVLGAVAGDQAGMLDHRPIPAEELKRLAAQLKPDTSAILVLAGTRQAEGLVEAMSGRKAQVVVLRISDELSRELR